MVDSERVLVVNVGSTSFKYQMLDVSSLNCISRGNFDSVFSKDSQLNYQISGNNHYHKILDTSRGYIVCIHEMIKILTDPKNGLIKNLSEIIAIGFKAVMAGEINYPVLVTSEVLDEMRKFNFVAPAHNPPYIQAIELFQELVPNIPLVADFETGFHRDIPDYATVYPYPIDVREKYNLRKYGFHGASHSYIAWKLPQILKDTKREPLKIISCHLGGSSSICAIKNGKSIDTSMGFSPQSGLPMNNRNGDLDIFSVLYLMKKEKMSLEEVSTLLSTQSGLKGISGISADVRILKNDPSPMATLALHNLAYNTKKYIGAYIAALNGTDVITFSGGIGENDPDMRKMICSNMDYLGISLDDKKNEELQLAKVKLSSEGEDISDDKSKVRILVLPTNEELMVAMHIIDIIKKGGNKHEKD